MKAIITVIGKDKTGIIAKVSTLLYENEINILDITQTIMNTYFTMIMMVEMKEDYKDFDGIVNKLNVLAKDIGVTIHTQHEDIFNSMHEI